MRTAALYITNIGLLAVVFVGILGCGKPRMRVVDCSIDKIVVMDSDSKDVMGTHTLLLVETKPSPKRFDWHGATLAGPDGTIYKLYDRTLYKEPTPGLVEFKSRSLLAFRIRSEQTNGPFKLRLIGGSMEALTPVVIPMGKLSEWMWD
jgi:hypothetical protein